MSQAELARRIGKTSGAKMREKPEVDAWDVLAYVDAAHGTYYERLILMEMCAGLRHGEAVGMMRWDVREEEGRAVLSVSKAVVCVWGSVIRKDTKTAFSAREVVLSGGLARRLLAARWPEGVKNPETVTHNWRAWCARNGVRYIPFGQMRSVFATLACEVCVKVVVSWILFLPLFYHPGGGLRFGGPCGPPRYTDARPVVRLVLCGKRTRGFGMETQKRRRLW